MTINVTGSIGTVALSAPTGTVTTVDVEFVSKMVAYAVEGNTSIEKITKTVAYMTTGVQPNNIVVAKLVMYAVLKPAPINRRKASWLYIGRLNT